MPHTSDSSPEPFSDSEVLELTKVISSSEALLESFSVEAEAVDAGLCRDDSGTLAGQPVSQVQPKLSAFIDESEQGKNFYFLGALMATDRQIEFIEAGFDSLLAEFAAKHHAVNVDAEFHGYEIMQARGKWKQVPMRIAGGIYVRALETISDSGASFYFEGINIGAQQQRYSKPWPARDVAMSHLLEQINSHAGRLRATVQLNADEHHTAEDNRQQLSFAQENGTYGYKPSKLEHCLPDFRFLDSRGHRCIQAADLITYILNRDATVEDTNKKALKLKQRMIAGLMPALTRGRHRIWP